ncbi:hypothetical protein DUNSADRAFT_1092 [Dunaliella salina]|uniref:Uncharacterized protein n=1 Tax=Dunaliella salina TaxID=3046 RepID=A0ABQ7GXJ7_DUNSA|nr:hypothetical protein DUNSADRAFT_1092 [Dunaliella salina]|eukprot:KAF5839315.1 hypothetical protein DUNSADRAFT_1092 [Dunaliella salina]
MATAQMMRVCGPSGQQQGLVCPRQGGVSRVLQPSHSLSRCCSLRKNLQLRRTPLCRAEQGEVKAVDLDTEVESFMKKQAEVESGAAFARTKDPEQVLGADVVDDETAKAYARELFEVLKLLKRSRDMSVNEVKLVVSIDDPRGKEQRAIGIEDSRGVSRDEMAAALMDVAEGRLPKDRIALKCLHEEVINWPFLDANNPSDRIGQEGAAEPTKADYQALNNDSDTIAKPYILGKEARAGDKPKGIADLLPDWVGYGTLYGLSAVPVFIAVGTILILFYNSLK